MIAVTAETGESQSVSLLHDHVYMLLLLDRHRILNFNLKLLISSINSLGAHHINRGIAKQIRKLRPTRQRKRFGKMKISVALSRRSVWRFVCRKTAYHQLKCSVSL